MMLSGALYWWSAHSWVSFQIRIGSLQAPGPVDLTEAKGPDSLQARDPDKVGRLENVGQALSSQAARVRHVLFF